MIIIPPISLNLSCFAISILACLFTLNIVASALSFPMYFPEFTSIAVKASVLSIEINPPHFSHTLLLSAFSICFCKSTFSSNRLPFISYNFIFGISKSFNSLVIYA